MKGALHVKGVIYVNIVHLLNLMWCAWCEYLIPLTGSQYDKIPPFNRISALAIDNCNQSSPCWRHTSRSSSSSFYSCRVLHAAWPPAKNGKNWVGLRLGQPTLGQPTSEGQPTLSRQSTSGTTLFKATPHQGQSIFEHLGQPTSDAAFLQQYWFICSGSDIVYFGKHFHNIKKIGVRLFTPSLTEGTLQWCSKNIEIGLCPICAKCPPLVFFKIPFDIVTKYIWM